MRDRRRIEVYAAYDMLLLLEFFDLVDYGQTSHFNNQSSPDCYVWCAFQRHSQNDPIRDLSNDLILTTLDVH
jgi:hypothetical protein